MYIYLSRVKVKILEVYIFLMVSYYISLTNAMQRGLRLNTVKNSVFFQYFGTGAGTLRIGKIIDKTKILGNFSFHYTI